MVTLTTTGDPPGETTHWTAAAMAKRSASASARCSGSGARTGCSRIGCRAFKLSNDPRFAEKLRDIVGLYVDPPAHAMVLSVDEKSQIQALDRTQGGRAEAARGRGCRSRRAGWRR